MKKREYKDMLLGIAIILFGIALKLTGFFIFDWAGSILPFVGIVMVVFDYFCEP